MENHHFEWVNQLQMAILNSYVGLPESEFMEVVPSKSSAAGTF